VTHEIIESPLYPLCALAQYAIFCFLLPPLYFLLPCRVREPCMEGRSGWDFGVGIGLGGSNFKAPVCFGATVTSVIIFCQRMVHRVHNGCAHTPQHTDIMAVHTPNSISDTVPDSPRHRSFARPDVVQPGIP
jgi:hypothetical protein